MNSHNNHQDDITLRHCLKNWTSKQHPPTRIRRQTLNRAAGKPNKAPQNRFVLLIKSLSNWNARPHLDYAELSRWLFSQAMLQSFDMSRTTLRMVS
ncbi:MAG: hypothetical protein GY805_26890 [Chloroflexi bacterium]|nr:hypothetical protein [Chloroflexota bacterium]